MITSNNLLAIFDSIEAWLESRHQIIAGIILLMFIGLSLVYVHEIPPVEGPDESGHILYINYILEHGDLPPLLTRERVQSLSDPLELWNTHTHHPPLYYMLGAVATSWTERDDLTSYFVHNRLLFERQHTPASINMWLQPIETSGDSHLFFYILRLLSVLFGALTIMVIYYGAYQFSESRTISLLTMLTPLAIPSFLIASASIGNDILLILLYTLGIVWSLNFWRRETLTIKDYLIVTVILIATIYTKLTGITLLAVIHGSLLLKILIDRKNARQLIQFIIITTLLSAIATAPWFYRLWDLSGSPLATPIVQDLWGRQTPMSVDILLTDIKQIWLSYWVSIGYSTMPFQLHRAYYLYALIFCLVGITSVLVFSKNQRIKTLWLAGIIGLVTLFLLYVNLNIDVSYGRLLLPALLPFALLTIYGWWRISQILAGVTLLPLLLISIFVTIVSVPRLYPDLAITNQIPDDVIQITTQNTDIPQPIYVEFVDSWIPFDSAIILDLYIPGDFPEKTFTAFVPVEIGTNQRLGYIEIYPGMANWATAEDAEMYKTRITIPLDTQSNAGFAIYIDFVDISSGSIIDSVIIVP